MKRWVKSRYLLSEVGVPVLLVAAPGELFEGPLLFEGVSFRYAESVDLDEPLERLLFEVRVVARDDSVVCRIARLVLLEVDPTLLVDVVHQSCVKRKYGLGIPSGSSGTLRSLGL